MNINTPNDMKHLSAIIIGAAIIIAAAMLPLSVAKLKSFDRTVTVKGLCEREVNADKVIWPLSYKVVGDDLPALLREIENCNSTILKFLSGGGVPADQITISSPVISDKYADEYGNNNRVNRYIITNVVTVCSSQVDDVLKLQATSADLLKQGVPLVANSWENQVEFAYEALNDIKPEMIEEATANAREAAQKFAQDSGSQIGKILTASQGTFSINDRDANTPYIKRVRVVTSVTYYLKR